MTLGYSQEVIRANRNASDKNAGVRLGRYCIKSAVPVSDVMEFFGVSKQTVYNWFYGVHEPSEIFANAIDEFLKRAK